MSSEFSDICRNCTCKSHVCKKKYREHKKNFTYDCGVYAHKISIGAGNLVSAISYSYFLPCLLNSVPGPCVFWSPFLITTEATGWKYYCVFQGFVHSTTFQPSGTFLMGTDGATPISPFPSFLPHSLPFPGQKLRYLRGLRICLFHFWAIKH